MEAKAPQIVPAINPKVLGLVESICQSPRATALITGSFAVQLHALEKGRVLEDPIDDIDVVITTLSKELLKKWLQKVCEKHGFAFRDSMVYQNNEKIMDITITKAKKRRTPPAIVKRTYYGHQLSVMDMNSLLEVYKNNQREDDGKAEADLRKIKLLETLQREEKIVDVKVNPVKKRRTLEEGEEKVQREGEEKVQLEGEENVQRSLLF